MVKIFIFKKKEYTINNFKFTLDWENEVLTEFKTFQYVNKLNNLNEKITLDYLAFPWATLLDLYCNKFKNFFSSFYSFLKSLNLLDGLPLNNRYITTIQSYHYLKFLDCFQKIGIKYIFCPHIVKSFFLDIFFEYDLIILPYIIYPTVSNNNNKLEKKILYNFIGNIKYSVERPTNIRTLISELDHQDNTIVKVYNKWHFDDKVYGEQLKLINRKDSKKLRLEKENYYRKVMGESKFSICPLGIGPNSIRLWESLTYKTIPVSISDNLWLPFYLDVNWNKLIINMKESEYKNILNLDKISEEKINNFNIEGDKFYKEYLTEDKFGNLIEKAFENKFILLIPWYNILDKLRYDEIHKCLEHNLNNKIISKIIFFYEVKDLNEVKYEIYNNPKIEIIPIITNKKRDISFNRIINYSNENLISNICIISNNDIYFDDTLTNIKKLNFDQHNYFLALTRKNCDLYLDKNKKVWKPHSASQDTWIFKSPIKKMKREINLGWIQCDNIIAEAYHSLNYYVINPHYDINCWHLHQYNNTEFLLENYNYNYKFPMKKIPLEYIEDIKEKKFIKEENNVFFNKLNGRLNVNGLSKLKKNWLSKN